MKKVKIEGCESFPITPAKIQRCLTQPNESLFILIEWANGSFGRNIHIKEIQQQTGEFHRFSGYIYVDGGEKISVEASFNIDEQTGQIQSEDPKFKHLIEEN